MACRIESEEKVVVGLNKFRSTAHYVDVIALSFSVGGHISCCGRLQHLMQEKGIEDKLEIVWGYYP